MTYKLLQPDLTAQVKDLKPGSFYARGLGAELPVADQMPAVWVLSARGINDWCGTCVVGGRYGDRRAHAGQIENLDGRDFVQPLELAETLTFRLTRNK